MTYQQFLAKLRETPREWKVLWNSDLRMGSCCPITAVDPRHMGATWFYEAAEALGIDAQMRDTIVCGADNLSIEKAVRRDLLAACGLSEDA